MLIITGPRYPAIVRQADPRRDQQMAHRGARIVEVPIRYLPRSREEGKKIGLRDWFIAIRTFARYRRG